MKATVNGGSVAWKALGSNKIYLPEGGASSNVVVVLTGVLNYIEAAPYTIKSVTVSQQNGVDVYSDVDLYYSNANTPTLSASTLSIRAIIPYNYVSSSPT